MPVGTLSFLGHSLSFRDKVVHLGHILHYSLDDSEDINCVASDICRKSHYLLQMISSCDAMVKTKLIKSHCLSLYGSLLWNISSKQIKALEIVYNNILRCI